MPKFNNRIKPPPNAWLAREGTKTGLGPDALLERWEKELTASQRGLICYRLRKAPAMEAKARAMVAAGSSDPRYAKLAARNTDVSDMLPKGIYEPPSAWMEEQREKTGKTTQELRTFWACEMTSYQRAQVQRCQPDRVEIYKRSNAVYLEAESTKWLEFRLQHSTGCVADGCPLGVKPEPNERALCLLEQDHIAPEEKVDCVSCVPNAARDLELAKTNCKCTWHHFLETARQRGFKALDELDEDAPRDSCRRLAERRVLSGCEHPAHPQMPYAPLVDASLSDSTYRGFLHVTLIRPREGGHRDRGNDAYRLQILDTGEALVMCMFCARLHERCLKGETYSTPAVQWEYRMIRRLYPSFVQYFDTETAGVDWVARRARACKRMSAAKDRRRAERMQTSDSSQSDSE